MGLTTFMNFGCFPSHPHQTISPLPVYHPRVVFIKHSYHDYTTCVPLIYKYVTNNNDEGKVCFYVAIITFMTEKEMGHFTNMCHLTTVNMVAEMWK